MLSGDAGTPEERRQLVEDFRDSTQILLSTEAGAEGLEPPVLQPGGQLRPALEPAAHRAAHRPLPPLRPAARRAGDELLQPHERGGRAAVRAAGEEAEPVRRGIRCFATRSWGRSRTASDFERRILDIYQSCRSNEEINAAFDTLRNELEKRIDRRMTEARSLLIERFDGDVRRRLRVAGEQAKEVLSKRRQGAKALTGSVLGQSEPTRDRVRKAAGAVRGRTQDAITYLRLDAASLPARLAGMAGSEGWWFAHRFETTGLKPEEKVVHLILIRDGESFRAIPLQDAELFVRLPSQEETQRKPPPVSVSLSQEQALTMAKDEIVRAAERRNSLELDVTKERADRFAEDCLLEPRQALETTRAEWEKSRRGLTAIEDPAERIKARAHAERAEREYRRKLVALRNEEEKRYAQKDRSLAQLAQQAKVTERRSLIASAYFWLS